jgi:hypothetical protein
VALQLALMPGVLGPSTEIGVILLNPFAIVFANRKEIFLVFRICTYSVAVTEKI